jgi:DNA-binding FadR family transcriptional regulator
MVGPPHGPAAGLTTPPRADASEQVAQELRRYIIEQELAPGDRLGTEQDLATMFRVSRPTLREAVRLLAGSHLVRARQGPGGGIFVLSTPSQGISRDVSEAIATMLATDDVGLEGLVEARIFLEVPLAGLAAQRATEATDVALGEALAAAVGHEPSTDEFRLADARFHHVIAQAAGNDLVIALTDWILDVLQPSLVAAISGDLSAEELLSQHRAIQRAIRARRPAAAERAMRTHLQYLRAAVERLR